VLTVIVIVNVLPLPDLPTKRRSLNRATWFFIIAVEFRSSAEKLSSLPANIVTVTPSGISPLNPTTLKATGNVLLHLQCDGNTLHTKFGESVFTSSPGVSCIPSFVSSDFSGLNRVIGRIGPICCSIWDNVIVDMMPKCHACTGICMYVCVRECVSDVPNTKSDVTNYACHTHHTRRQWYAFGVR